MKYFYIIESNGNILIKTTMIKQNVIDYFSVLLDDFEGCQYMLFKENLGTDACNVIIEGIMNPNDIDVIKDTIK